MRELQSELKELGFYEPNGVPVVHMMTGTEALATAVHELCHQDLASNTIYGYVMQRLAALASLDAEDASATKHDTLVCMLIDRAWQTFEGHATLQDLLHTLRFGGDAAFAASVRRLPNDYRAAVKQFLPLLTLAKEHWEHVVLISAAAEYVMDRPLMSLQRLPKSLEELAEAAASATITPDSALLGTIDLLSTIPLDGLLRWSNPEGPSRADAFEFIVERHLDRVGRIKAALVEHERAGGEVLMHLASHEARAQIILPIESELRERYPQLPSSRSQGRHNDRLHVRPPDVTSYLGEVTLEPLDFVQTIELQCSAASNWAVVLSTFPPEDGMSSPVMASAIRHGDGPDSDRTLRLGDPYWRSWLLLDEILECDRVAAQVASSRAVWTSLAVPAKGRLFGADFFERLRLQSYLYYPFSGLDSIRVLAAAVPDANAITAHTLAGLEGLEIHVIGGTRVSVFMFAPQGTMDALVGGQSTIDSLNVFRDTDAPQLLAAAVLVTVKTEHPDYHTWSLGS